jgi:hypothetical protein
MQLSGENQVVLKKICRHEAKNIIEGNCCLLQIIAAFAMKQERPCKPLLLPHPPY